VVIPRSFSFTLGREEREGERRERKEDAGDPHFSKVPLYV